MATSPNTKKQEAAPVVLASELELLKTQAGIMQLEYPEDVDAKALRKIIMGALSEADNGPDMTNKSREELNRESNKLIRAIVMPVAAHMREYQGQLFSAGNSVVGVISKFIQFNTEYHIPNIILKQIEAQQMQYFVSKKINGQDVREAKMAKAFNVTILPTLSQEDLNELARGQENRNAIDR